MYKTVIGLEIHTELNTESKIFSPAKNKYSLESNVYVKELDIALPGTLPFLNKEVLKKAIKLCKIYNMNIADKIIFDRKNYYYPDLPKGYQITQNTLPIGTNGYYEMINDKKIRIHDIHIEEDTASLTHYDDYTLINYNRSGIPLLEIVTEPDFNSVEEVMNFLEDLRFILKRSNISEAEVIKGQMRCDLNINLKDERDKFITPKVEVKNVNSFKNIKDAINVEVKRQIKALENNEKLYQETRRYNEKTNSTILMRTKEDAIDYRYFVESNIPIFKLDKNLINEVEEFNMMPNKTLKKYVEEYKLNLINSKKIVKDINLTNYFNECIKLNDKYMEDILNLITGPILEYLNKTDLDINSYLLKPVDLVEIISLKEKGDISTNQVKEILLNINEENISLTEYINKHNMKQLNNEDEIIKIIKEIFNEHKEEIEKYKKGNKNMIGFFVGCVMKKTSGKVNPSITNKLIVDLLEKE